ncbi:MAG: alpha-galactosidase [Parabacteroides sp.]|nr:alpha-galactosidase [Parabacteroides sp.]
MNIKQLFLLLFLFLSFGLKANEDKIIPITTNDISLIYKVDGKTGRLYQAYLGQKLSFESDIKQLPLGREAYLTHGMEDFFEPAVRVLHNDGNPSLLLKYISHENKELQPGVNKTVIVLKDDVYPVEVKLCFLTYAKENIIKEYTEISHQEKKPVVLYNYASSMLHLNANRYFLTDFSGAWAKEVCVNETELKQGKRVVDSKLGSRASKFTSPFFLLSIDGKATETEGELLLGTIGWTGNFRFVFEVDNKNGLRVISGINPYGSEYTLKPNEVFRTPEFIFTYSAEGKGKASRDMHRWARKYQLKDGEKPRMTLLNNWEATGFKFNEDQLVDIMDEAVDLGVDMFLLDDGWFANKYPRMNDRQGLGDWDETVTKLPNGIGRLVKAATDKGIKFGLWIEPEMVNPKSELYEKHKDWVIRFTNREEYYYRSQLCLDLSNPEVQDYVFSVVDDLMTKYPGIAYFKWDCNSPITNIYSSYLKDKQSHLHVRGLYKVLDRVKAKYPDLPMMLCSGGGGRCDYEALKYFTEFWPSDNTDPIARLYIQWGFSTFFPVKSMAAHVTSWNKNTSVKFRTDVASMCKLGFDIRVHDMSENDLAYCKEAVINYNRLSPVILDGDQYRLVSPYDGNRDFAAVMYANESADKAVLFAYSINPIYLYNYAHAAVRLQGLKANARYKLEEINLYKGTESKFKGHNKVYSGEYLMKVGLPIFSEDPALSLNSRVIEITEVK